MIDFAQEVKVIATIPAHAHSGSVSCVVASVGYVNMENYAKAAIVVTCSSITGAGTMQFRQAKGTSASSQKALSIDGYWTNAAALASASIKNDLYVYTAYTSGSSSQATGTQNGTTMIFQVDDSMLDVANSFNHIGIGCAAANLEFGATIFLYNPRYASETPPTAL